MKKIQPRLVIVATKVHPDVRAAIEQAASQQGRSISNYLRRLIAASLRKTR